MEIDKLKSAWEKVSSHENNNQYTENQFRLLLNKRTNTISEKIKRNIKLGLGIIIAVVLASIAIEIITIPLLDDIIDSEKSKIIEFLSPILDSISYVLILGSSIVFLIKFNKTEKQFNPNTDLENTIKQKIRVIKWYRNLFYLTLIFIIIIVSASFTTGFVLGFLNASDNGTSIPNSFISWAIIVLGYILSLSIIVTLYYILFNLFYKRLYGRHLKQLTATLRELKDPENNENE